MSFCRSSVIHKLATRCTDSRPSPIFLASRALSQARDSTRTSLSSGNDVLNKRHAANSSAPESPRSTSAASQSKPKPRQNANSNLKPVTMRKGLAFARDIDPNTQKARSGNSDNARESRDASASPSRRDPLKKQRFELQQPKDRRPWQARIVNYTESRSRDGNRMSDAMSGNGRWREREAEGRESGSRPKSYQRSDEKHNKSTKVNSNAYQHQHNSMSSPQSQRRPSNRETRKPSAKALPVPVPLQLDMTDVSQDLDDLIRPGTALSGSNQKQQR